MEPQPDIVLLRPECRGRAALPSANDVLLVIEVADTTLARDREIKIPLYASHAILEAWLFDLGADPLRSIATRAWEVIARDEFSFHRFERIAGAVLDVADADYAILAIW